MCGITGWVDWERDLTDQHVVLERMADSLQHRGPDARGQWLSQRAALAHLRLIVIDPEGGKQPMVYQSGEQTYVITYNGEIYNFRELRNELESRGHTFRTRSDTEVLLHVYIEWGEESPQHLNGIFAFGLWDEGRQRLFLARDHMGVKPLFYAQRGSAVLFGSEIKALLAHPLIKAEVDKDGLAEIFSFGRAPGSGTFRNISEVRPGYIISCTREQIHVAPYWLLQSAPHTDDLDTTTDRLRGLLEDIVRRQLISDVPLAALLSGGIDSSALTALAGREFQHEGRELHTYALDFVESEKHFQPTMMNPSLDAPWAHRVSEHVGSKHHVVRIDTPELVENLLVSMHAHDLPTMGQLETSMYLLFREMKKASTVALSGESADEVFGGYAWFHRDEVHSMQMFPWMQMTKLQTGMPHRDFDLMPLFTVEAHAKIDMDGYLQRGYDAAIAEVPRLEGEDTRQARIRELFYLNLTRLLPTLINRKDRCSMAVGFEVRVPYCDYRLVEYIWNIPWDMKNVGGIEKGILRRALTGLLPNEVRMRKKSVYPTTQNPSYTQALSEWVQDIVSDTNAPIWQFLDKKAVQAMLHGKANEQASVWNGFLYDRLIQINAWFQDYRVAVIV